MAITTPYGLELARDEDSRDAVADAIPNPTNGKLKIFLGDDVDPGKVQSIVGTLTCCFNVLLEEHLRHEGPDDGALGRLEESRVEYRAGAVLAEELGIGQALWPSIWVWPTASSWAACWTARGSTTTGPSR